MGIKLVPVQHEERYTVRGFGKGGSHRLNALVQFYYKDSQQELRLGSYRTTYMHKLPVNHETKNKGGVVEINLLSPISSRPERFGLRGTRPRGRRDIYTLKQLCIWN